MKRSSNPAIAERQRRASRKSKLRMRYDAAELPAEIDRTLERFALLTELLAETFQGKAIAFRREGRKVGVRRDDAYDEWGRERRYTEGR